MDKRIIQLESISASQDRLLRDLNEELFRQQRDMARLEARIGKLEQRIAELENPGEVAGGERPPHW